ncbi:MAG: squalene/phytoene synthase family protein [Pirellulaceae bacterium]|nr:squalene/phytoene synthase family protein [Pirellulaceae bacterium]
MADKKKRILPPVTLAESYQLCRERVRHRLGDWIWTTGNVDGETRNHLYALTALTVRTEKLCDIHLARAAREEMLEDLREDFRNNFMEEESTDQFPALLDTMNRYPIPQQYFHDIVAAADMCIRIDQFSNFDQWLQMGCRLGGGTLLSAVPILGFEKPGFEDAAIKLGQAIYLTRLLNDIADEIQKLEFFLPREDLVTFQVDLKHHNPSRPDPAMLALLDCMVERIERLYHEGGELLDYMALDGRRVLTTVVAVSWSLLLKIKRDPKSVLLAPAELSASDRWRFRLKHILGLEDAVEVLNAGSGHGHS